MKKTKIICIMGPDIGGKDVTMELVRNGMDVARFSFSHGDYNEHQGRLELLKEAHKELGTPVAALLDTKGPEIRTGQPKDGKKVTLKEGQTYTLTTRGLIGDDTVSYISYNGPNKDMAAGNRILIDDGPIELEARETKDMDIVCKVIDGGEPGEEKEVNVSNIKIRLPALTDKDKEDIRFGIRQGLNFIAASFVCTADCTKEIKAMLDKQGPGMKVVAKIENAESTENLDTIIGATDGIMVVRGNMGVEIPAEKVPHIQRKVIRRCNEVCKIITAVTQVLDSMIHNPRPTRAEVTDVVNAVYDGMDTMILSGGTAMDEYPVDALKMMVSIVLETERHLDYVGYRQRKVTEQNMKNVSNAVCFVSVSTTHDLDADVIIASSIIGFIIQTLPKWRPDARIIGMSSSIVIARQMQSRWGVIPVWSRRAESMDELIENSAEELKDRGLVEGGELVVITTGVVTYTGRHEAAAQISTTRVTDIE